MAAYLEDVSWSIFVSHDHISSGNKHLWLESGWRQSCLDL